MRHCFCVLGWHYHREFYEALYRIPGDKHIVSHRDGAFVAASGLLPLIGGDLHTMPNRGLDFGGYHQFNKLVGVSNYDFIIYCHDDVRIKDLRLVDALCDRFADPAIMLVGNGSNGTDAEFRFAKYRRRMFWDDDDDFIVRTVRGSFFAARSEVFRRIGNFPVHWKASSRNLRSGNVSLRNFCYLVTKTFGIDSITYLEPDSWLNTRFLTEYRRGAPVALGS
jgi:hypothetical protein